MVARQRRDAGRGHVRLLSAEPTLLDREVSGVAGREDMLPHADDPAALVDRDEAVPVTREASDRAPLDSR